MIPSFQEKLTIGLSVLAIVILVLGLYFILVWRETRGNNDSTELTGPIRYNCALSGGAFKAGRCICPIDEGVPGQTQDMMYDKNTGFCQSTIGGPAGDAFAASIGLPYGEYDFWNQIVMGVCVDSGGSISGAACICPSDTNYSKTNGKCE